MCARVCVTRRAGFLPRPGSTVMMMNATSMLSQTLKQITHFPQPHPYPYPCRPPAPCSVSKEVSSLGLQLPALFKLLQGGLMGASGSELVTRLAALGMARTADIKAGVRFWSAVSHGLTECLLCL